MEVIDPKLIEAYGNLGALATICVVFIVWVVLVFRSFQKMMDNHTAERERINKAYIAERETSRSDYLQALNRVTATCDRTLSVVERIDCVRSSRYGG